jgi:hypothetical protein
MRRLKERLASACPPDPWPPVPELHAVADSDTLAVLQCLGTERSSDRWLPIAESIEFLPAEE